MTAVTVKDVAEWMASELRSRRELYQEDAAAYVHRHFGNDFVYINNNGNWAISKEVLSEFTKITKDDGVWVLSGRYWRLRQPYDDPHKRVAE